MGFHLALFFLNYEINECACVFCWPQLINNKCCEWTGPCGSYYDCKAPFSNNYHETLKQNKDLLLIWSENYIAYLRPHSKVSGREREWRRERNWDQLGLSLLLMSLFHQVINHNLWYSGFLVLLSVFTREAAASAEAILWLLLSLSPPPHLALFRNTILHLLYCVPETCWNLISVGEYSLVIFCNKRMHFLYLYIS